MDNPSFVKVKEIVTQWIKDKEDILKNVIIEIIENTDDRLYVILNFSECMAAIVVAEPDFAPYRFVSFEAGAIVNGNHNIVHAWYDEDGTTIDEVIKNLNNAIDVVLEYNNRIC
jgi:hypothetical protein